MTVSNMIRLLLMLCFIFLNGCSFFRMGENVLIVSGDLSKRASESCSLHLIYDSEISARSFNIRLVSGDFMEDFVVSPNDENYTVEVICNNKVVVQKTAHYPNEVHKFNLGKIN